MKIALHLLPLLTFAIAHEEQVTKTEDVPQTYNIDLDTKEPASSIDDDELVKKMSELIEALRAIDPSFVESLKKETENLKLDFLNLTAAEVDSQNSNDNVVSESKESEGVGSATETNKSYDNQKDNASSFENNEL